MFRMDLRTNLQVLSSKSSLLILGLFIGNLIFNILANASFKVSATSGSWRGFLTWQVIGNLAGFITVITLTGLLRFIPLNIAFPVTTGLAVIGVQLVAAKWFFDEAISPAQWLGALLIVLGILLIGGR